MCLKSIEIEMQFRQRFICKLVSINKQKYQEDLQTSPLSTVATKNIAIVEKKLVANGDDDAAHRQCRYQRSPLAIYNVNYCYPCNGAFKWRYAF